MNGAQAHLLLNHLPVLGTAFAAALLAAGLARRSDELQKAGLWATLLAGLSALPAYFTGEGAEHALEALALAGDAVIHPHEEAAELALACALLLGAAAGAALALHRFRGRPLAASSPWVLGIALAALALMARTAHLGGLIRHSELLPK